MTRDSSTRIYVITAAPCADPENFLRGWVGTSFRPGVVTKILPLQKPIFWKIEGGGGGLEPLLPPHQDPPMCAVTNSAQLICTFSYPYVKSRFSLDAARIFTIAATETSLQANHYLNYTSYRLLSQFYTDEDRYRFCSIPIAAETQSEKKCIDKIAVLVRDSTESIENHCVLRLSNMQL